MNTVYDLWFEREYDDRADTELHIGIYASREDATAAIEELKEKPGFEEYPEGFQIHETLLGRTGWTEGFNTTFGPPPKDAASEAFDVPAWVAEGDIPGELSY
jgi:hypothetical protein